MAGGEISWAIETSKDGERWRFFGKAWTKPGEALLLHGVPRFARLRPLDPDGDWSAPLERTGRTPMTLLHLEEPTREEVWPDTRHAGLPVLFPGGQEGRLLRFERDPSAGTFTWAVEFRGTGAA